MISTEVKLRFLSSLGHLWPDLWDNLSKVALGFEKLYSLQIQGKGSIKKWAIGDDGLLDLHKIPAMRHG